MQEVTGSERNVLLTLVSSFLHMLILIKKNSSILVKHYIGFCVCVCVCMCVFRAAPKAYGISQARGRIGAAAAGLHHSHSSSGSELGLRPTPQLTEMPDL